MAPIAMTALHKNIRPTKTDKERTSKDSRRCSKHEFVHTIETNGNPGGFYWRFDR